MTQLDEWEEWREVYARLRRRDRQALFRDALYQATRPGRPGGRRGHSRGGFRRQLRRFLGAFPSGVALVHGALMLAMLGVLPPAPHTPPALLGIGYVLSLNTAVWLWWAARWVWRRAA